MTRLKSSVADWRWNRLLADYKVCAKLSSLSFSTCDTGVIQRVLLTTQMIGYKHQLLCVEGLDPAWPQLNGNLEKPAIGSIIIAIRCGTPVSS